VVKLGDFTFLYGNHAVKYPCPASMSICCTQGQIDMFT